MGGSGSSGAFCRLPAAPGHLVPRHGRRRNVGAWCGQGATRADEAGNAPLWHVLHWITASTPAQTLRGRSMRRRSVTAGKSDRPSGTLHFFRNAEQSFNLHSPGWASLPSNALTPTALSSDIRSRADTGVRVVGAPARNGPGAAGNPAPDPRDQLASPAPASATGRTPRPLIGMTAGGEAQTDRVRSARVI